MNNTYRSIKGLLRQEGTLPAPPPGRRIISKKEQSRQARPRMAELLRDTERNG